MALRTIVVVSRREGERPVALKFEQGEHETFLSLASAWGTADHQREVAFLTELHLEMFVAGVPHRIGLGREASRHQYLDMVSAGNQDAKHWFAFAFEAIVPVPGPQLVH